MSKRLLLALLLISSAQAQWNKTDQSGHANHAQSPLSHHMMDAKALKQLSSLRDRAFDVQFARLMIDHHQQALDMARLALNFSKTPQIRTWAEQISDAQNQEITLMNGWLQEWTGKTQLLTAMKGPYPTDVDRWFTTGMIPHHQGAIDMAKLAPGRSQNPAVLKLAAQIVKSQKAEIEQFQHWLHGQP